MGSSGQSVVASMPLASTICGAVRRVPSARRSVPSSSMASTFACSTRIASPPWRAASAPRSARRGCRRPALRARPRGLCAMRVRRAPVRLRRAGGFRCRARSRCCLRSASAISSSFAAIQRVPQALYAQSSGMRGARARHRAVESRLNASSAGLSSITTRWPMPAPVAPPMRASSTSTRRPACASACAQAAPTMPAPMTITSASMPAGVRAGCPIRKDLRRRPAAWPRR
jgi:hypothetical protein